MKAALALVVLAGCIVPVGVGPLPEGSSGATTGTEIPSDPSASASMTGTIAPDLGGVPTDPVGLAVRYEVFAMDDEGGATGFGSSVGGSDGGDTPAPGTLVIQVANVALACDDPTAPLPCDDRWALRFQLGPDELFAGAAGELADHAGTAEVTFSVGPDECAGGAGTLDGKFEVLAIDDASIEVRLTAIQPLDVYPADITFVAERC